MNKSISILNSVELLPLNDADINPFLTKVRIKVFHLGENRNHSYIDKETAIKMAKTLRGNPIVARYREEKEDFTDHGQEIVINDKGIECKVLTKPYGFVDLNAKVWFEDFDDTDEFGRVITHTYLVTEGQVWTEQYQELKKTILDGGRPQSMELHEQTLEGTWSDEINSHYSIFIINDAIITKLCALGADTEPCFLGASIAPEFELSEEDSFVKELIELKNKFQFALNEGGLSMENTETTNVENQETTVEEPVENFSNEEGKDGETIINENDNNVGEFAKKDEKEDSEKKSEEGEDKEEEKDSKNEPEEKKDDKEEEDDSKKKYELLQNDFEELKTKFASLEEENAKLLAFKQEVENKQKDDLIASFYMLSDEDKQDVVTNKAQYSLEDIEAKLSVICVRKKVNFDLDNTSEQTNENTAPITYNLDSHQADSLPAWLRAVEDVRNRNK